MKTLDDLNQKLKKIGAVEVTSDETLQLLSCAIDTPLSAVKDTIRNWNMVSFRDQKGGLISTHLVGYSENERTEWMTSIVVKMDLATGMIKTKNSYYLVKDPNTEAPGPEIVNHIFYTLNTWMSKWQV